MNKRKLNRAIAKLLGLKYVGQGRCIDENSSYFDLPSYCSNWNDLMAEIDKLDPDIHVNITHQGNEVELVVNGDWFNAVSACLKRALAECLLKALAKQP
jgi:hypothetical protein